MIPILYRAGWRHALRHPWLTFLTLLGVAVAVAVVVGIDLANTSASRAFRLSVEGVAGRASHEIVGGAQGLPDSVYTQLRLSGLDAARGAAPIVEGRGRVGERRLRVLGLDPFAEPPVRDLTANLSQPGSAESSAADGDLTSLLVNPGAIALTEQLAGELGIAMGDELAFDGPAGQHQLELVGFLRPADDLARRGAADLIVADIATAQELLGRVGRLDRIDLVLPVVGSSAEVLEELAALLPPEAELRAKSARSEALDQMTEAFRLNLTALSLLALLVGMFLIYNTLTFSVVQRRPLIGRLRAMGVQRREIMTLVLSESLWIGGLGTLLGLALGVLMARGLLGLVVQTINDLYFGLTVTSVELAWTSLAKGLALGIFGTLLAAWLPAREATAASPRAVLQRSRLEARSLAGVPRLAGLGLLLCLVAALLLVWPSKSVVLGFAAVFVFVIGFACLVPAATVVGARALAPICGRFGILGTLAARGVTATLSRTGVAVAALVIAVATTVGVAVMVHSFRATLVDWLGTTLQADIYASAAGDGARRPAQPLDPAFLEAIKEVPAVELVSTYRRIDADTAVGPSQIHTIDTERRGFDDFRLVGRPSAKDFDDVWRRFDGGEGVLISEPYAYRYDLATGSTLQINTDSGQRTTTVLAVFYDYATDRGMVLMDRQLFDRWWRDRQVSSLGIYLRPGSDPDQVLAELRQRAAAFESTAFGSDAGQGIHLQATAALRKASLDIFDRTFVITNVLRIMAVAVAFLGILGALMALQLERARELGVMRANGLTPRQVWGLVTAQTGILGLIAGLLAAPLGVVLSALLVTVINKRSFGWTLHLDVPPAVLLQAVALAVVAALLAGVYPAWRMSRSSPALALREE